MSDEREMLAEFMAAVARDGWLDSFDAEDAAESTPVREEFARLIAAAEARGAERVRAAVERLEREWRMTAFPDAATADMMQLDLRRLMFALTAEPVATT